MPTFATNWNVTILRAMFRATYSAAYVISGIELYQGPSTLVKSKYSMTGAHWNAAANGVAGSWCPSP